MFEISLKILLFTCIIYLLFNYFLSDTYDILNCCAALGPNHLKAETVKEMVDLVKPGK